MSDERNLTEGDVEAIVMELKTQLLKDFQLEVGRGLLGWAYKAMWLLLLAAAVYGIAGDRQFLTSMAAATKG